MATKADPLVCFSDERPDAVKQLGVACKISLVSGQEFWWWACWHQENGRIGRYIFILRCQWHQNPKLLTLPWQHQRLMSTPPTLLPPRFRPPKVFTSKIDFLCHYLLPRFAQWFWETAWKITMLHLLNWPCKALPLEHASSQEVKRQVCQAHAENTIMKSTGICKSVCAAAHLHSFFTGFVEPLY